MIWPDVMMSIGVVGVPTPDLPMIEIPFGPAALLLLLPPVALITAAVKRRNAARDRAALKQAERALGKVAGGKGLRKLFAKARRTLKPDRLDRDKGAALHTAAMEAFAEEVSWRRRAAKELASGLAAYDEAISNSIGLRLQKRLSLEQAKNVASCQAHHYDISLNF